VTEIGLFYANRTNFSAIMENWQEWISNPGVLMVFSVYREIVSDCYTGFPLKG
jgi:hypothetical protein